LDGLAAALACGAGALDGEEALARAHFAGAVAHAAGGGRGAGLGAAARTALAGDAGRHADLRRLALIGFAERDLHVVAEIGAALAARTLARAPLAHELAEQVVEHLRH